MRRISRGVASLALVGLLAGTVALGPAPAQAAPLTRVVVLVSAPGTPDVLLDVDRVAAAAGATARQRVPQVGLHSYSVPASAVAGLVRAAQARGARAEVAPLRRLTEVPDDPGWAFQEPYLGPIRAGEAWDVTHGSASVRIAVIDSGVDVAHPDLAGKVVGRFNAVDGGTDVTDDEGHGTFVAGVAAAVTGNALGVVGTGRDSAVLAVKVMDPDGFIGVDDLIAGIVWAADDGADVLNLSLGGDLSSQVEADAIAYAQAQGAVVVAAAGNDASTAPSYPAAYPDVLAVGATNTSGTARASFSNHGSWVSVAAPGVDIVSTVPTDTFDGPDDYAIADGTSFSAPLVAGQVALLRAAAPAATPAQLSGAVVGTAVPLSGQDLGAGLVDLSAALASLVPATRPTVTSPASGATLTGAASVAVTSGAAQVQLSLDGVPVGGRVDVVDGAAVADLPTWGWADGGHVLGAADCTALGCGGVSTVPVSVDNPAPSVLSPAPGALVGRTLTVTGDAGGGSLAVEVDGVRRGTAQRAVGSPPYSLSMATSALSEGTHQVRLRGCDAAGTRCQGRLSSAVSVSVQRLHPSIVTMLTPFSPNGDGVRDTASFTVRLAQAQSVRWQVRNSAGTVVRALTSPVTLAAGDRVLSWNGRSTTGGVLPNGTYTVDVLTTSSGTPAMEGRTSRTTRIDTVRPGVSAVVGSGGTFYPYADGYRDTKALGATVSEAATVQVRVINSSGKRVRTLSASRSSAGKVRLAWNGRTAGGTRVAAGTYGFSLVVTDRAGNRRTTAWSSFRLSWRATVTRSATFYKDGMEYSARSAPSACVEGGVDGAYVWMLVRCYAFEPGAAAAWATWSFAVPSAVEYVSVRARAKGYSSYEDALLQVLVRRTDGVYDAVGSGRLMSVTRTVYSAVAPGRTHVADGRVRMAARLPIGEWPRGVADAHLYRVHVTVVYRVWA